MDLVKLVKSKTFEIKNKSQTTSEITIYGAIGDSFFDDSISANDFDKKLKELPDTVNKIELRINSPGGDVFDGITIYNRLKRHKAKVIAYIDGLSASIASIIMMAADEIVMGEGALVMIHKPMTRATGNSLELEETINRLDDVEDQLVGIYQRKTKMERAEIKAMLAQETWMDAKQALELGFVNSIMEDGDAVDMAASLESAYWINKKPKVDSVKEIVNKEIDNILKGI